MRLLLDSHALLWWLSGDSSLSTVAAREIEAADSTVTVSVASIWELSIKIASGRLSIGDEDLVWAVRASGFDELDVTSRHAVAAAALPRHHGDPFDRMLVAQAQLEGYRLVTRDRRISHYDVVTLW